MTDLTSKKKAFIGLMTENEDLARRGFSLLIKRPDFADFFEPLQEAGVFNPSHNPAPVPAEQEGYFQVPYWSALDYLVAVAKKAGEEKDVVLSRKLLDILRSITIWRDAEGKTRENYHTAHKFTQILSLLPVSAITIEDLNLVPAWLNNRFERMLVVDAIDEGVMGNFLSSPREEDWQKAVVLLTHCMALEPTSSNKGGIEGPQSVVETFWLRRLVNRHAADFGKKIPKPGAEVLRDRLREVFAADLRKHYSEIYRPAVEDDPQNREFYELEILALKV